MVDNDSVARRFGPENQDYKKKSEFVRFSFDVDAGKQQEKHVIVT